MARPSKSVNTMSKNLTKAEREERLKSEQKLRGNSKLTPPKYLNKNQNDLFKFIVSELKEANILSGLDTYVLETCVIAIDRLQQIENMINQEFELVRDKNLMSAKDKYTKDLYRCCNELSLSPQSRAKLSNINLQAKKNEEDPLLKVLAGGR